MTVRTLAAAALFVALGAALAQPPKPAAAVRAPAPPAPPDKVDILKRLAARVELEKAYEGKFRDAVKMVADRYELPVVLTRAAEQRPSDEDAEGNAKRGDQTVKLPKLANVKIETVLTLLCEQTDTKFLVYPDHIKIVPAAFAEYESATLPSVPDPNDEAAPLISADDIVRNRPLTKRALVNASLKGKPLGEALDEIAEATGANVAVSPLLPANVRQQQVTVRFANTPVDAAVRTLCEMTETGVIEDANVLLVTTRERAAARAKEDAQKLKDKQPVSFGPGGCMPFGMPGGLGALGGAAAPADAAELAKLKAQNDDLSKQIRALAKTIDDLQKTSKPVPK